jgi:hypothetical protein
MLAYRVYLIGSDGHFYDAIALKCTNDDKAIEMARQLGDPQSCGVQVVPGTSVLI